MQTTRFRVVLDTNILVRAFVNLGSTSGLILQTCEQRLLLPLLSKPVIAEYKRILASRELVERYPQLQPRKIQISIDRLRYVGEVINPDQRTL